VRDRPRGPGWVRLAISQVNAAAGVVVYRVVLDTGSGLFTVNAPAGVVDYGVVLDIGSGLFAVDAASGVVGDCVVMYMDFRAGFAHNPAGLISGDDVVGDFGASSDAADCAAKVSSLRFASARNGKALQLRCVPTCALEDHHRPLIRPPPQHGSRHHRRVLRIGTADRHGFSNPEIVVIGAGRHYYLVAIARVHVNGLPDSHRVSRHIDNAGGRTCRQCKYQSYEDQTCHHPTHNTTSLPHVLVHSMFSKSLSNIIFVICAGVSCPNLPQLFPPVGGIHILASKVA